MFPYIIRYLSVLLFLGGPVAQGQKAVRDTTKKSEIYGLRVGIDLSRPLISVLNDDYTGLEISGDYRISQHFYLAAELGSEERTVEEALDNADGINRIILYEYENTGSYIKLGVDYNTYTNWFGMNNSILVGARYAFSAFSNTLESYRFFDSNRYWSPEDFVAGTEFLGKYSGLNASWLELLAGVKTELFANIYLGGSIRLGILVTDKDADIFTNTWIPGFNRNTDNSRFGWSFNYTLSYLIPIYRKDRSTKPTQPE